MKKNKNNNVKIKKDKVLKKNKQEDKELYTKSVLIQIMCAYIVFMFIKEILTHNFLINLYIDSLVGIVAFYIAAHNAFNQYKILNKYKLSLRPFIVMIVTMIVGIFVIIMTLKSPFDISFLHVDIYFKKSSIKKMKLYFYTFLSRLILFSSESMDIYIICLN